MAAKTHYSDYVADQKLLETYNAYQDRYKSQPRESDKVVLEEIARQFGRGEGISILDIGCSTGNFLRHLRRVVPEARLFGSDLAQSSVEKCKTDPTLSGIEFYITDALDISALGRFHAISAIAVAVYFDWPDYERMLRSICASLHPGGIYYAFEWIHPFAVQDITIIETNEWNPSGLTIRFRPMKKAEAAFLAAGFSSVEFRPFSLPIDLAFPGHDAEVVTYTRKDEHGERMAFRGVLYQPWCHIVARKAG